ncbi:unnamed protein product [Amoebophrya sp. A25]|nr:unnamed protein product [Amoebophrya sp. A25]|eukprot:GSA25T00010640001.1
MSSSVSSFATRIALRLYVKVVGLILGAVGLSLVLQATGVLFSSHSKISVLLMLFSSLVLLAGECAVVFHLPPLAFLAPKSLVWLEQNITTKLGRTLVYGVLGFAGVFCNVFHHFHAFYVGWSCALTTLAGAIYVLEHEEVAPSEEEKSAILPSAQEKGNDGNYDGPIEEAHSRQEAV